MNPTEAVVDFLSDVTWEELPGNVRKKSKMCLLDTLGAAIAGKFTPAGRIVSEFSMGAFGGNEATVVLTGRTSATGAALANGYMANALDIDDGGKYTRGHPGAQVIPTVLGVGEKVEISGREALTAIAWGYEVAHRVGGCWHDLYDDYRSCGSWGSVVSAAISARLMGLSKKKIEQAMEIADYNSPYLPMMRSVRSPSMVKHGTGWGAMTGIISAEWAKKGFTGSGTSFDDVSCESWFEDFGERYIMAEGDGVEFKEIPSCSWGHPAINELQKMMKINGINRKSIDQIKVYGFSEMANMCSRIPESEEEAQFSVIWPMALVLVHGRVTIEGMKSDSFSDPEVRSMADRIEVIETEELDELNKSLSRDTGETSAWPSRIIIKTKEGREFDSGTVVSKPVELASMGRLMEKFDRLVSPYFDDKRMRGLKSRIDNFQESDSVQELTSLLEE